LDKKKIILELEKAFEAVVHTSRDMEDGRFFHQPEGKWSAAENLGHLILAVKPLNIAFRLPRFILRLLIGKANRPSLSYVDLVAKYQQKLAAGGRASRAFIPKSLPANTDKATLLRNFQNVNDRFLENSSQWKEEELDIYMLPHPLLGKLTIREMLYFTVYHTQYHHEIIKSRS
jgi:DinB superfamily